MTKDIMNTKRVIALLFSGLLTSPMTVSASNPASMQWVKAYVQSYLGQSTLTDANWEALCPNGVANGCFPDCQGAQSAACQTNFDITSVQNYLGVTQTVSNGLYVRQFVTGGSSDTSGPLINNQGLNSVTCGLFTTAGHYMPSTQQVKILGPGGPTVSASITPTIVAATFSSRYSQTSLYNTQALPSNSTFYIMCFGYTTSGLLTTNANAAGLSVSW